MKGSITLQTGSPAPLASQMEAEAGTDNTKTMTPLRTAQAIAALGGGGVDVQEFTESGTWVNPSPYTPRRVCMLLIGGGGGGASGRRGASGSSAGGGSGCGAGLVRMEMLTTDLASTESLVVGSGGAGGASVTTNDTNWTPGSNGSGTTFKHWTAGGGNGAATATPGAGVNYVVLDQYISTASGTGGSGHLGNAISPAAATTPGGTPASGGGGGGGNASTPGTGAKGVSHFSATVGQIPGGAGGSTAGEDGGDGVISHSDAGTGGGGGAGGTDSVPGGAGGNGVRGGGGGGGGGSVNGADSGAGGNGGNGYALIITY